MMGQFATEDEILQAIYKSGYLMEHEIADMLERHSYHVVTNSAFKDIETEKSREIDVLGIKRILHDEEDKIDIFINLICECKNNTHSPFVFIGRNKTAPDKYHVPEEYVFPIKEYRNLVKVDGKSKSYTLHPAFLHLGLDKYHYFHRSDIKYTQFSKIIRKNGNGECIANHEDIFDSILYPLIKSFLHRKSENSDVKNEWKVIWLYFPIVVLNSNIYSIDSTKKDVHLQQKSYLTLLREINSKKFSGKFLIDFTNKEHFEEYLTDCVENFSQQVMNIVTKDVMKFLTAEKGSEQ